MNEAGRSSLTVYFEEPFWVGVVERVEGGRLSVSKITFGAEPRDAEIYAFVLRYYAGLRFGAAVKAEQKEKRANPKKRQRDIKKQLQHQGVGTKAQQALKMQHEQNKLEKRVKRKEQRAEQAERLFELKQQKKKEKHKGH